MRTYESALNRLRQLPSVFRGADLTVRFQWNSKKTSHYLYLWKRRGLIEPLGGHSDVFANMIVTRSADWPRAMIMAMPSSVTIGIEALRQASWTTQIPIRPTVAVNRDHSVFSVRPYEVVLRSPMWFERTRQATLKPSNLILGLLRPAWALADMLHEHGWGNMGLWPDDVHWDEASSEDNADWQEACEFFNLPLSDISEHAIASR